MRKINLLFIASELAPIAKAGGLADVAGSLPAALTKKNVNLNFFLPFHQTIDRKKLKNLKHLTRIKVPFHNKKEAVDIWTCDYPNARGKLYLFHSPKYLSRGHIYKNIRLTNPLTGKTINNGYHLKYIFFSKCAYHFLKHHKLNIDVYHFNDWHTVPIMLLLKNDASIKKTKSLLTIHNLKSDSLVSKKVFSLLGLPKKYATGNKKIQIIKLGIQAADIINTVSPTYAKEILTKAYGNSLAKILKKRSKNLYGILNGLDQSYFDPRRDKNIKKNYSLKSIHNKKINKLFLQRKSGLPANEKKVICGLVSRISQQKGFDLILHAFNQLAQLDAQFIFVGDGNKKIENSLKKITAKYPDKFYFLNEFNVPFAQQIYAGADIFLMPSRFEPCGLGQLIAMRYGTVPVVRATGGLKDTVKNNYNGFVFNKYDSRALTTAVKKALNIYYNDKKKWQQLIKNGMSANCSWDSSAKQYIKLYKKLLNK